MLGFCDHGNEPLGFVTRGLLRDLCPLSRLVMPGHLHKARWYGRRVLSSKRVRHLAKTQTLMLSPREL
jgi:hypothetical protein